MPPRSYDYRSQAPRSCCATRLELGMRNCRPSSGTSRCLVIQRCLRSYAGINLRRNGAGVALSTELYVSGWSRTIHKIHTGQTRIPRYISGHGAPRNVPRDSSSKLLVLPGPLPLDLGMTELCFPPLGKLWAPNTTLESTAHLTGLVPLAVAAANIVGSERMHTPQENPVTAGELQKRAASPEGKPQRRLKRGKYTPIAW